MTKTHLYSKLVVWVVAGKRLIQLLFLAAPCSSRYRTGCQVTPFEQIGLSNNVETISLIWVTLTWFCIVRV